MTARLPANLMLVEDERIVAFDLKRQLQGFGYHVGPVLASGEQAIDQVGRERPDLVLMDIHLEGRMDGIEAAAEIRARHQIPVVFLTAYAEDGTLSRALNSRPFGYLVKPCEGRELHATIQMALARREDEMAVEQSEQRLQLALDAGALGVLEWSPSSDRMRGDVHLAALFGNHALSIDETREAFIARVAPSDRDRVYDTLNSTLAGAEAVRIKFRTKGNGTQPRYMEVHVKAYGTTESGGRVVGILQDVSERHNAEERLRQSSVVFHATAEAILITNAEGLIEATNSAFSRITEYSESEVIGLDPEALLRVNPGPERYACCQQSGGPDFWHGPVRCYRKSGTSFPAWQSISTVRDADHQITHLVMAFSDVTAIYEAQQQLHHLAHHDTLTGLPNRLLFDDRLQHAIDQAARNKTRCLLSSSTSTISRASTTRSDMPPATNFCASSASGSRASCAAATPSPVSAVTSS